MDSCVHGDSCNLAEVLGGRLEICQRSEKAGRAHDLIIQRNAQQGNAGAEQDHETRKDKKVKGMEPCYGNKRCEEWNEVARSA